VAGRTPSEAVTSFLEPFQRALSCVTDEVPTVSGGYHPAAAPHALTIGRGSSISLRGAPVRLSVIHDYRIVEDSGPRGPWKIQSIAYFYALEGEDEREILAYHWHPDERFRVGTPHAHLGPNALVGHPRLAEAHLPTGRVALEEVIRLAIGEFRVTPNRDDWLEVLERTQAAYYQWRTWG